MLECFDHKLKEPVALKVLKEGDQDGLKEAKILEELRDRDPHDTKHILRIRDRFMFRGHLMLTFDMLDIDLEKF